MDNKERFDQIESLLVSLIQKVDRQEQFNARQEQFNTRQEQFNARQEQFNIRQEKFNVGLSDQMQDVINILKMSVESARQSAERQEKLMRQIEAQGRRTDATQAEILRMMEKWDAQDVRNEATDKHLNDHQSRIQRLEDDALRQAS